MHNKLFVFCIESVLHHIAVCEERFKAINEPADFTKTKEGGLLLDGISMRLQAIGENVKKLLKIHPELETKYAHVEWNKIIRFRDFISHHYEKLDYEIIYEICADSLPLLKKVVSSEAELIKNTND